MIENNGTGIYVHGGGSATVGSATPGDGNTISGNGIGIQVGDGTTGGNVTATLNTLSNDTTGIKVDVGTLVADNNLISGGSGDSVLVATDGTPSVTLNGNELANSGLGVDNQNAATVDASENYWGSADMTEAAVFAETSGSVDYTPWFDLSTNNAVGTGFVGDPSALDVGSGGAQTGASGRIGEAVADLSTGGTIKVFGANAGIGASGVYVEQVAITKDLTLSGTDEATTIIRSPATLATNFTTSAPNKAVVYINGATVDIDHLTIDGNLQGDANYRFLGLAYYDASGTADHLTIENVSSNPFNGVQSGNGYYAFNDLGANTVTVSNSDVFGYQKNGITANGTGLTANITDNTVTGQNIADVNGQNGIQIGFGAPGDVSGNIVSNDKFDTIDTEAAGILLYEAADGTTVTGNTVTGSDNGVSAVDSNATVDSNILTGNTIGVVNDGFDNAAALVITNNEISGGGDGIQLYDDITGTTIHNNFIRNNTGTGILVDSSVSDSSGPLHVNDNFIAGNATAGIDSKSSGVTVDATLNWWGSSSGPTAAGNTFNVGSQGDKITGPGVTNFIPWLIHDTDTQPAVPGFQPDGVTFAPVEDLTTTGLFSSIQSAIDAANPGDIIHAFSGMFSENVDVSQSVMVEGDGQGLTTVVPATSDPTTGGSLDGSVIFLVDANDVTIRNLTVDGNNPNITSNVTVGGVDIDARTGIITNWNQDPSLTGFTVKNVTVKNIYLRGIEYSDGIDFGTGLIDIENDTVTNVQGDPASSVAIFNFGGHGTIAGNSVSNAADAINDNWSYGTEISGNTVTNSASGIHTDNNGGAGGVADSIHDNNVSAGAGAGSIGIFVFDPYLTVAVQNNTVSGVDTGLAVYGGQGGSAAFSGNTVSVNAGGTGALVTTDTLGFGQANVVASFNGDSFTGASGGGVGILVQQLANTPTVTASATIIGVTVNDPTYGIEVNGGTASISGSTIENNSTAGVYVTGGGSVTLTGNTITLNGIGVEVGSTGTLTSATGNRIANNSGDGIRIDSGATSVGAIANNDLSGNGAFAVDNQSGLTIDASLNRWGVNTELAVAAETNSNVDYTPWFDNGNNSAASPGFSGDFSHLDVGSGGAQVQAGGRINEAIGDLTSGGTITVYGTNAGIGATGVYAEDVDINKLLTLKSASGAGSTTIQGQSATGRRHRRIGRKWLGDWPGCAQRLHD